MTVKGPPDGFIYTVTGLFIFIFVGLLWTKYKSGGRKKELEELKQTYGIGPAADDHKLRILIQHGFKIEAIKTYRNRTGEGLKQSKVYIDYLADGGKSLGEPLAAETKTLTEQDISYLKTLKDNGDVIGAIKKYRNFTGVGLKEAKEFVESL